ncbi:MAG: hypothetical protein QQN63_12040, partial [Nitrosopumilus sp.]
VGGNPENILERIMDGDDAARNKEPRRNKVDETNELLSAILEISTQLLEVVTVIADHLKYPEIDKDYTELPKGTIEFTEDGPILKVDPVTGRSLKTLPNSEKYIETPEDEGPPRLSPSREVWNIKQRYLREQEIVLNDKTAQLIVIAERIGLTAIVNKDGTVAADFEVLRIWEQDYGEKIQPENETFSPSGEGA